ncbi:MAG: FHA domain-containing protein [Oscillospiraceae bacterium]|nr:FHA domain-containing protein [Oscillospiraceae bacterium]
MGRFSSAAENGVDPVVGWLVCVKGPYYGQSFPLKSGKNRIGRAQSMDVRLLNDSSVSRDCVAVIVYDAKIGDFSVIPGDSDSLCYWNEAAVYAREQLAAYDTLELGDSGRNAFIFVPLCGERFSWADRQPDEARRD